MKRICLILMVVFALVACSSSSQTATPQHQTKRESYCVKNKPGRYAFRVVAIGGAFAAIIAYPLMAATTIPTAIVAKKATDFIDPTLWEKGSCKL